MAMFFFAQSDLDGIVGLAYLIMVAYNFNPLFDNIMQKKLFDRNVFPSTFLHKKILDH